MDALNRPAVIHFLPGNYEIVQPGDHVVCAVTGRRIPIPLLRYWNAERQEAYVSAEIATRRYAELNPA